MATTKEQSVRFDALMLPALVITTDAGQPPLAAGEAVLKGTFAMLSDGKVMAAVANPATGAKLLGIALDTYDARSSLVDVAKNMVFQRGECWMKSKAGDLPDAITLLGNVYVQDNAEVGKTSGGANALAVKQVGYTSTETKVLIP